jgi:hypothetical protein
MQRITGLSALAEACQVGKYVLVIAMGSTERVVESTKGSTGLHYFTEPNTWHPLSGVFLVPKDTAKVRLSLNQAKGRAAETDSAARFDNVGVYIFDSAQEAQAIVKRYHQALK